MPASGSPPPPHPRRSHLAPFLEGHRAWLVLGRNAIPVVGVFLLGWSGSSAVFQIWFDGATALGAMLAFQVRGFARKGGKPFEVPPRLSPRLLPRLLAVIWLGLFLLLGIPYWFVLLFFCFKTFGEGFWGALLRDPWVTGALLLALACNVLEEAWRGYDRMGDAEVRREFNWEFSMHLARICAMMLVAFLAPLGAIAALALALSYVEIYPMRTLRILGGDSTLDPGNEDRSPD